MARVSARGEVVPVFRDVFERIYIINLAERADRRREMAQQLARVGLSFEHPMVELVAAQRPLEAGEFPSIGARGCFLSHLDVLTRALRDGHRSLLLLEDDVDWTGALLADREAVRAGLLETEWQFVHGGHGDERGTAARQPVHLRRLAPEPGLRLAHFIGLRGPAIATMHRGLTKILERRAGAPEGGPMHVDGAYTWIRCGHPDLPSYVCAPSIARQRSSRSSITPPDGIRAMPIVAGSLDILRSVRKRIGV